MTSRYSETSASTNNRSRWLLRLITTTIWLVVALFAAFWAMKFIKARSVSASPAMIVPQASVDSAAIGKILGVDSLSRNKSVSIESSANLALFGVASTAAGGGVALISTDGKPAKPYRIGGKVTDTLTLKSVSRTEVKLSTANSEAEVVSLAIQVGQAASGVNSRGYVPAMLSPNAPRFPLQQYNPPGTTSAAIATMPPNMPSDASRPTDQNTTNAVSATMSRAVSKFAPRESTTATVGANGQAEVVNSISATDRVPRVAQEAPVPSLK